MIQPVSLPAPAQIPEFPPLIRICSSCNVEGTYLTMRFRRHYGGFWLCRDTVACDLRRHLSLDAYILEHFDSLVKSCPHCTAGTSLTT
jgi:hypothetical protein